MKLLPDTLWIPISLLLITAVGQATDLRPPEWSPGDEGYFVSHDQATANGGVGNMIARDPAVRQKALRNRQAWNDRSINNLNADSVYYFDPDSATLMPTAQEHLRDVGQALAKGQGTIEIYAGTDDSETNDLALSRRRAEGVRRVLIQAGVSSDRIVAGAFGKNHPSASNATVEGQDENRSVEVRVLS